MSRNANFPAAGGDARPAADAETEALRACARQLLDAVAAEPVPERLRTLALALEEALDRQRSAARGAKGVNEAD